MMMMIIIIIIISLSSPNGMFFFFFLLPMFFLFSSSSFFSSSSSSIKRTTHNTHITSIVRFTIVAFWYVILKGHWRIANHIKIKTRQNTRCVIVVLTRFVSYHFCDNFHEKKEKNIVILTKQE